MYATTLLLALATSAMAAPLAPRDDKPADWATGYLEPYATYHARYLNLQCWTQHNTSFFEDCCHPLLADQTFSAYQEKECVPPANSTTSTVSAVSAAETTAADSEASADYSSASSIWATPSTTSQAPAQTSQASNNNNNNAPSGDVKTGGYATYFYQNGNPGACGQVHSDWDKIIAIDANGYWPNYQNGQASSLCGKWINIKNTQNGKTVTAMVADVCPTCDNNNSLDLSVGAFTAIASEGEGMVPISWSWA